MAESTKVRALRLISLATLSLVQVFSTSSLLASAYPDPACEQQCRDDYIYCLDYYCDPRGTCTCWTDYQSCVSYCPVFCDEPKSFRDFETVSYINRQPTQTKSCFQSGGIARTHNLVNYQKRTDTYRETTHCNGTKTTQLINSSLSNLECWRPASPLQFCSSTTVLTLPCPF